MRAASTREGSDNREGRIRLDRVFDRIAKALGKRASLPLAELTREDAKAVRDHMMKAEKWGGGTLSPASVKRELKIVQAVVNHALREFDLPASIRNPFDSLEVGAKRGTAAPELASEKRDPLPEEVIMAMRGRLKGELLLIWRLLDGTGCRLAEVSGLRAEDVIVEGDLPHLKVRWNEVRRLKTDSSVRSVPLVGDALEAAREALRNAAGAPFLFPCYARERGSDAASAALMKHLRLVTKDKRHTVHSLRHAMKDRMRAAGVDKALQDLILGHSAPSVAENYGSDMEKLRGTIGAMRRVFGVER